MDGKLIKNIISLTAVLGANYIIPLLTLPYLVATLGPKSYGVLGFSLAFSQYFSLLVDYGFNLSATRQIAMASSKKEVSCVFWNVMACKLSLVVASLLFFFITIHLSEYLYSMKQVLIACVLVIIGNALYPLWLFQGKESMGVSAIVTIASKTLSLPLVFIFVINETDAWIAGLITSLTTILGGLLSLIVIYKQKWISFHCINFKSIRLQLVESWHIFISSAAVSLYTTSIPVVLGFISGPVAVGYFVAADKLRQAAQGLISPLSQAFYPRITSVFKGNAGEGYRMMRQLIVFQGGASLALSIMLLVFSVSFIEMLYGVEFEASRDVLIILSICPFLIGLSNALGIQTMLVLGYKKQFSNILLLAGICGFICLFPLSFYYSEKGAALAIVLSEILVTLAMYVFLLKKNTPLFKRF